jgi:hypothetical protein
MLVALAACLLVAGVALAFLRSSGDESPTSPDPTRAAPATAGEESAAVAPVEGVPPPSRTAPATAAPAAIPEHAPADAGRVRELLASSNPAEQLLGIREITALGDRDEAVALLVPIQTQEAGSPPPWLWSHAAGALAELGGSRAATTLAGCLEGCPEWMASSVARLLARMDATSAVPSLRAAFPAAQGRARADIAIALRRLGDPAAARELSGEALAELASADPSVRARGARRLGLLVDPAHNVHLVQALSDASSDVRRSTAGVLAQQGGVEDLPALRLLLEDADASVVEAATRAIHLIEHPEERGESPGPPTRIR